VRDTGHGISADNLHRVFDPFFTTRLGQGGSGLGLHIVHNLVQSVLGGRIEVESQPNQGACFRMTLPLHAPERMDGSALPVSDG
jgi:signal transduction histidine kinase